MKEGRIGWFEMLSALIMILLMIILSWNYIHPVMGIALIIISIPSVYYIIYGEINGYENAHRSTIKFCKVCLMIPCLPFMILYKSFLLFFNVLRQVLSEIEQNKQKR